MAQTSALTRQCLINAPYQSLEQMLSLFQLTDSPQERRLILFPIEGERTEVLVLFEPDILFVVVLKPKIFPDNRLSLSDEEGCHSATFDVTTL
jgi:hypothetical protein